MDPDTTRCYPMAVQAVHNAIAKDNIGLTKEAYCSYLSSILLMVQALKDEASYKKEMIELCHDASLKLYTLIEHSLGRAHDILVRKKPDSKGGNKLSSFLKPLKPSQFGTSNSSNSKDVRKLSNTALQILSKGELLISPVLSTPSDNHQVQNHNMFQAYQKRKSQNVLQKYASCDQNMSMLREMYEKKKIDDIRLQEYKEKTLKRNEGIKSEAERRWKKMTTLSCEDKDYRQSLLETILAYEVDSKWPKSMRDKLALNCEDVGIISEVTCTILTYNGHPLCMIIKKKQFDLYSVIEPLIRDFKISTNNFGDDYLVPVEDVSKWAQNSTLQDTCSISNHNLVSPKIPTKWEPDIEDKSSTDVLPSYDKDKINVFVELEDDMFSSDSENEDHSYNVLDKVDNLESDITDVQLYDNLWQTTEISNYKDAPNLPKPDDQGSDSIYQDPVIFHRTIDSYQDNQGSESIYQDPVIFQSTIDSSHYESLTPIEQNIYEDITKLDISKSLNQIETLSESDSDFTKKSDSTVQDIRFEIDRLHSIILLTYESLNNPVGRDVSYATLECIFFKPLWPWIINLFRKINMEKEIAMNNIMKNYKDCDSNLFGIRDKFRLIDQNSEEPYLEAIEEMRQIVQFTSPLDKLECSVRVSKAICDCVEKYYSVLEEKVPLIGCDDLLPIMSFVVLKSQLPQIVSECCAMTEFVYDGYLMGEEGYCLTTLHAAISYVLSFSSSIT